MDDLSRPKTSLTTSDLAAQITELAGHLNAAQHPNGTVLDSILSNDTPMLTDWTLLPAQHHKHGPDITAKTAATRWGGERMDYGMAVEYLLIKSRREKNVSAETSG